MKFSRRDFGPSARNTLATAVLIGGLGSILFFIAMFIAASGTTRHDDTFTLTVAVIALGPMGGVLIIAGIVHFRNRNRYSVQLRHSSLFVHTPWKRCCRIGYYKIASAAEAFGQTAVSIYLKIGGEIYLESGNFKDTRARLEFLGALNEEIVRLNSPSLSIRRV